VLLYKQAYLAVASTTATISGKATDECVEVNMTQWQYGKLTVAVPRTAWAEILRGVVISFEAGGRVTEFSTQESALNTLGNQEWEMIGQSTLQDENWEVTTYTFKRTAEQAAAAYEQERQERERHEKWERERQEKLRQTNALIEQRRAELKSRPLFDRILPEHPDLKTVLLTTLSMLIAVMIISFVAVGILGRSGLIFLDRAIRLAFLFVLGLGVYTRYRGGGQGWTIFLALIDSVVGATFGFVLAQFFI
jgi:hypothetical protein